jgi:hypothetical protein
MGKVDDLMKRAKALVNPAPFRVIFKDGTSKTYHAPEVIPLFLDDSKEIARIEHDTNDTKNGLLPMLFSGLLETVESEPDGAEGENAE